MIIVVGGNVSGMLVFVRKWVLFLERKNVVCWVDGGEMKVLIFWIDDGSLLWLGGSLFDESGD